MVERIGVVGEGGEGEGEEIRLRHEDREGVDIEAFESIEDNARIVAASYGVAQGRGEEDAGAAGGIEDRRRIVMGVAG